MVCTCLDENKSVPILLTSTTKTMCIFVNTLRVNLCPLYTALEYIHNKM